MKVLVLGATGGSGQAAVKELLEGGHEVTAFSRHAEEALPLRAERLHRIDGDAMRAEDVERAVAGQDAVVVALGVNENPLKVRLLHASRTPVNVCSEGTRHAIAAMHEHGVRRLVVLTAYGVGETHRRLSLPWRAAFWLLLREQMADKERQERLVRDSGLDWVLVQPVGLTNLAPRGTVLASPEGEVRSHTVTRGDVGRFLAEAVEGTKYLRRSVALSG